MVTNLLLFQHQLAHSLQETCGVIDHGTDWLEEDCRKLHCQELGAAGLFFYRHKYLVSANTVDDFVAAESNFGD